LLKEVAAVYDNQELPKTIYDKSKNRFFSYNIKDIPTKAEYYYTLGLLKDMEGDISGAVSEYEKSLELLPFYKKVYTRLITLYIKLEPYSQKTKDLREKEENYELQIDKL